MIEIVKVKGLGGDAGPAKRPESRECLYEPKSGDEIGVEGAAPSSERWEKRRRRREDDRDKDGVDAPDDGPLFALSSPGETRGVRRRESRFISLARGLGSKKVDNR